MSAAADWRVRAECLRRFAFVLESRAVAFIEGLPGEDHRGYRLVWERRYWRAQRAKAVARDCDQRADRFDAELFAVADAVGVRS